jgi:nucleolar GTP-binding protein
MKQPFEDFPSVYRAQELIDYAFRHATDKAPSIPEATANIERVRRKEVSRIENASTLLIKKIRGIIEAVPNLDELPAFYKKLSNLLVNNDELRLNLGRLNGVIPVIQRLQKEHTLKLWKLTNSKECAETRVEFFGRVSSAVKKQDSTLQFLQQCREKLQTIPTIDLSMPCVVVAGYPNVGKSSIVGWISTAKPYVAEYPFTTKQIFLGMYEDKTHFKYFQVIDTPGILDRPMTNRNEIEQQAILALNTIATIVIFIFDPTMASGYEVEHQIRLYEEIRDEFLKGLAVPIKVVINKIDFASNEEIDSLLKRINLKKEEVILTNAKDGVHVDEIKRWLLKYFNYPGA